MNKTTLTLPVSPVTGRAHVTQCDEIPVADIIRAYAEIGVVVPNMFPELGMVKVYRCEDTGYRFYHPFTLAAGSEFYTLLQNTMNYYAEWRWEHNCASGFLDKPGHVLEIGCGTGNFLSRISEVHQQQVVGLELNIKAQQEAEKRGLSVYTQHIEDFAVDHSEEFDTVCSFHVLEHITDVASFLESACATLKCGGYLILAVPNNNPHVYKHDRLHALNLPPHHMGLWDRAALASVVQVFPLEVVDIRVAPLQDPGFYWSVYLKHLSLYNSYLHKTVSLLPWKITRLIIAALGRWADGPNLIAVYRKTIASEVTSNFGTDGA